MIPFKLTDIYIQTKTSDLFIDVMIQQLEIAVENKVIRKSIARDLEFFAYRMSGMTLQSIADKKDLSRERVRQIISKVLSNPTFKEELLELEEFLVNQGDYTTLSKIWKRKHNPKDINDEHYESLVLILFNSGKHKEKNGIRFQTQEGFREAVNSIKMEYNSSLNIMNKKNQVITINGEKYIIDKESPAFENTSSINRVTKRLTLYKVITNFILEEGEVYRKEQLYEEIIFFLKENDEFPNQRTVMSSIDRMDILVSLGSGNYSVDQDKDIELKKSLAKNFVITLDNYINASGISMVSSEMIMKLMGIENMHVNTLAYIARKYSKELLVKYHSFRVPIYIKKNLASRARTMINVMYNEIYKYMKNKNTEEVTKRELFKYFQNVYSLQTYTIQQSFDRSSLIITDGVIKLQENLKYLKEY